MLVSCIALSALQYLLVQEDESNTHHGVSKLPTRYRDVHTNSALSHVAVS